MTRWQLFRELWHHERLQKQRSQAYKLSGNARIVRMVIIILVCVYLLAMGVVLGIGAGEEQEPFLLLGVMPFALLIDLLTRISVQETPVVRIRPYILLPVSRFAVIDGMLLSSFVSVYNLVWVSLWLPYVIVAALLGAGVWASVGAGLLACLLFMLNTQWFTLCRTLADRSNWWLALPFSVGLIVFYRLIASRFSESALERFVEAFSNPYWCVVVAAIPLLYWINRRLQFKFVYDELAKVEKSSNYASHSFSFLDRFGLMGEYFKLEIKSIMRNRNVRNTFLSGLVSMLVFSLLVGYTSLYNSHSGQQAVWFFYCFVLGSVVLLGKVMSAEGNYIDLLMVHQENIYRLLLAKYYFNCVLALLPLGVMIVPMLSSEMPPLMIVSYFFFSIGFVFFLLFQMAVTQRQTIPLNESMAGKQQFQGTGKTFQMLANILIPYALLALLIFLVGQETACWIVGGVGLAFTLAHPLWLKQIYRRMMSRRYENLEGFRETRS